MRDYLSHNMSSVTEVVLAITFVPFLIYFMLSWQDHVRAASVMLFRMENRNTAYVTLGLIAAMIRSFIVGNFMIGLFLSAASMAAFGLLGLPYFYFLGVMSGFLSLVPYLGSDSRDPAARHRRPRLSDDRNVPPHVRHRGWAAPVRHECALSDGAGEAPAIESAGGHHCAACSGDGCGVPWD